MSKNEGGFEAKWRGLEYGEKLDLPLTGEGRTTCPHTGTIYALLNGKISASEVQ